MQSLCTLREMITVLRSVASLRQGSWPWPLVRALPRFRNDEYLWWQVAGLTYDTYLVHNRTRT